MAIQGWSSSEADGFAALLNAQDTKKRAAALIDFLTDDRDPSTRDLLVLMAIQHNAHESWLEAEELHRIMDEIREETLSRLPEARR